jgi:hypothetical protein
MKVSSIILLNSIELELVTKTLVSSAKSIGIDVLFKNKGRSFIYINKSKGLKIDPWGTP